MADHKLHKGDRGQTRVRHNGVKAGAVGRVVATYNGPYYAMSYPGVEGICYSPEPHVAEAPDGPDGEPDADDTPSDTGMPTSFAMLAQAHEVHVAGWQKAIKALTDLVR